MSLELSNLTLWSCVWSHDERLLERTAKVLRFVQDKCKPKQTILFTSVIPECDPKWKTVRIPELDAKRWSKFVNYEVPKHIHTDFSMSVHEDGFPVNLDLWTDDFLKCDYIGAPWPDKVVGNGGFNIESKKLMQAKLALPVNDDPSDVFLCRTHRNILQQSGIQFAPVDLATRFSTEQTDNDKRSFGFHGRTVATNKYSEGWTKIKEHLNYRLEIVYIFVSNNANYEADARRFVQSYIDNPPGERHVTTIVCNNGQPSQEMRVLFSRLPNLQFLYHDNSGYDIGGYQVASKRSTADLIVFFGASTYYRKPGWLTRIVESYISNGTGLYGAMGNMGAKFYGKRPDVFPHIRTTAFWLPPSLMNEYPMQIKRKEDRYDFEHGENCLSEWVRRQGIHAFVVNWNNEYDFPKWDASPNGFHRGNQSDLIAGDHISAPPFYDVP